MANTFFKTLSFLEEDFLQNSDKRGSKTTQSLLSRLINFVESGEVVDSDVEKFIVKNFRLTSTDITTKWNEINYDRVKSKDTIRGQVSVLNRYFCSLFDISADALNDAFVTEDADVLMRLSDILVAFDIGDFNIAERFPILQRYLPDDSTDSVYTAEECAREIHFLKTLDKSVIEGMLAEIDKDKLIYVLQSIRQPLLNNFYRKSEDKNSKQKLCSVNQEKVAFYKAFNLIKPKQLKPVESIEVPEKTKSGVEPEIIEPEMKIAEPDEKVIEPDAETPVIEQQEEPDEPLETDEANNAEQSVHFNLSLSSDFEALLLSSLEKYKSFPVAKKLELSKQSTDESKQRCKSFFQLFTEDGFKKYINSLNGYDVICELEHFRK